jgi:glycosyltransferase involved in cell wall biosynthesis
MANINSHAQNQPLITIGMSCFNARDTIARALDSALAQDWPNVEIVVVDDGSNDDSVAVINDKIHGRGNCRLIVHGRNRGFPAALNSVVGAARGDFLAIWDDDDESRSDRLSVQYRRITEYEETTGTDLIACYASGVRLYPNGYDVPFAAIGSRPEVPVGMCVADYHLFGGRIGGVFYGGGTPSCSLMVRTTTLDAVGPYDESLRRCEDSDFAIRLARQGGHFIGCEEPLIRQFATGGSDKNPEVEYESHVALIEKYRDYVLEKNRYRYALDWQKIKFYHFSRRRFRALVALAGLALRHPAWTIAQFRRSAPARLVHERRMKR